MQRVCAVNGGSNEYEADPARLVSEETRRCPFCASGHRLRLHGWYERYALEPDPAPAARIPVRRLLCPFVGRTVSLLPDFCLPRRQHGPEILGEFLAAHVRGASLLAALRSVRGDVRGHSVAQNLRSGFLTRRAVLQTYLAATRARAPDPPAAVLGLRRELGMLVAGLSAGFRCAGAGFRHHGRLVHARFAVALA